MKAWKPDVSREACIRRYGNMKQLGGLKRYVLSDGKASGVEAVDVETGVFALFLGNRVQNRLTVLVPEAGKSITDYGLKSDGTGSLVCPNGARIYSSVNYVYQKDTHFHQAVAEALASFHAI